MNKRKQPSIAAVIDALKLQSSAIPTDWKGLEDHVQHVYQSLLDMKGEKAIVARDVTIRGRNGQDHQVDVYYEFELAGLRHQVAIECKNTKRAIDKDRVLAFSAKINDCPSMRGIIVSANGYQSGAKKFAEDNGLSALTFEDLPSIGKLLGMRLESFAIPTEEAIGQPFWAIYEAETGAPLGHEQDRRQYGLLFFSKRQARNYFEFRSLGISWMVRGMTQENLRIFILTVDAMGGGFLIVHQVEERGSKGSMLAKEITRRDLISEFYVGSGKISEEPMVAPWIKRRGST